ncbi:MAG: TIGR03792 family protein [Massiliimalia sp.]|jgi:uncharacterized protein (TIGR03792 family)
MELHRFEKPAAVEELVFRVKPECLEEFIQADHEIWTLYLAKCPGFMSKEVWVSDTVPGEVTSIIYWSDYELWQQVSVEEMAEVQKQFDARVGVENYEFVSAPHETSQKYRVTEYK